MDDIKRQNQIQKVESLIKKQNVSRRDFFGSLGKIAVLSQVVALGAFNFLSSCVAMEDKKDQSGYLKDCISNYVCPDPTFGCFGEFNCEVDFQCPVNKNFTCPPIDAFNCNTFYADHSG
jgi:hypothetical protein